MFFFGYDFGVLPNCVDLELFGINFNPSTDFEEAHQFFPVRAGGEMFMDTGVFLRPTVLRGSVVQGVGGFPDVGFSTAWAGIFIDDRGGAQKRCLVFVGCEE